MIRFAWRHFAVLSCVLAALSAGMVRADIVTFDDLVLAPESHWNGPDPAGANFPDPWGGSLPVKVGSFSSGGASFNNSFNENYGSWSGFAYSNASDTSTAGYLNQYSAFTGTGHGPGADIYGVAFGYSDFTGSPTLTDLEGLPNLSLPTGGSILGAYVTNTTYAALSMQDGDSFAKAFGGVSGNDPDWFLLTAYGVDATGHVLATTVSLYLADYRFSDNSLDYILDQWTWLDLSSLANAVQIFFNVTSSDVGQWGMNTPAYFAIDDIAYSNSSTSPVPEPGSLVLAALGGAALLIVRRRSPRS